MSIQHELAIERRQPTLSNQYRAPLEAGHIALCVLGLFYYWFGVADRYAIFLYGHRAPGIALTQPFDAITRSRYWMAGYVAAGAVMVLYTGVHWLLGQWAGWQRRVYTVSPVWQVWLWCCVPLSIGILGITMTVNAPTLPLALALQCVVATLVGLFFALLPAAWAVNRPLDLVWLGGDGLGLSPFLLFLRAIELPGQGVITMPMALLLITVGIGGSLVWLGIMTFLRRWRRRSVPPAHAVMSSGICINYLLLPLVHYLFATPPAYRYLSNSANFFATAPALQLLILLITAGVAIGVTYLRRSNQNTTIEDTKHP